MPQMRTSFGTALLLLLTQSDKTWHVHYKNKIRDENDRCPVCSALNQKSSSVWYQIDAWKAASDFLGREMFPEEMRDVDDIAAAADVDYVWSGNHVRSYLDDILIRNPKPIEKRSWWEIFKWRNS